MPRKRVAGVAVAAVLLLALATAGETTLRLLGDDDIVWLVAPCREGTRIAARSSGAVRWVTPELDGEPTAACAAGGRLHLFYFFQHANRGFYEQRRHTDLRPSPGDWPQDRQNWRAVAACSAGGGDRRGLFVLLTPDASAAQPAVPDVDDATPATEPDSTTSPESRPAADRVATRPAATGPTVFGRRAGVWEELFALGPWPVPLPPDVSYRMAATPEALYVLACTAEGWPLSMGRWSDGRWEPLAKISWRDDDGEVRWLVAVGQDLFLAGTGAGQGSQASERPAWLRRVDAATGEPGQPTTLARAGQPLALGQASAIARYGMKLAVAWGQGQAWRIGVVDLQTAEVTDVLEISHAPETFAGWDDYFRWAPAVLTFAMGVAWVVRQRSASAEVFSLPAELAPAMWLRRACALLLDFIPLTQLAIWITGADPQRLSQLWNRVYAQGDTPEIMQKLLLWVVGLHLLYAVVMEGLFSATLGKLILRLRVVGPDGARPSPGSVVLRNITRTIEMLSPLIPLFAVWPVFNRYHQRIGDMLASTTVVSRRSPLEKVLSDDSAKAPAPSGDRDAESESSGDEKER